jgi:adenylate cyclase
VAEERTERRLAAILAADVVGYSRMMGADEVGTLNTLTAHLSELIEPLTIKYNGRIVKTTGDGLLAEFASVIDAVQCAVAIQRGMTIRNADTVEDRRIAFRIGINIGDIIVQNDDVFGDGVNVAARLEGLADPGGICISRSARDQIRDRLDYILEDMGEVAVKNIARPVRVFKLLADGDTTIPRVSAPKPKRRIMALVAVCAVLVAASAGVALWQPWIERVEAASVSRMKFPLPDKPSIAVMPFRSLSKKAENELLSRSFTEDVTSNLARISSLFVIARNSTAAYDGKVVKMQQVAEELGVQHVVEGSVRHESGRMRVSVRLVDVISGRVMWSDRFDREVKDIFELQDEITRAIATELAVNLTWAGGGQRLTDNIEAYLIWLSAQRERLGTSPNELAHALTLAERAIKLDPGFGRAYALLGYAHTQRGYFGYAEDRKSSLHLGLEMAKKAIELADGDWYGHMVYGQALMNTRAYEQALAQYDRAIALNPANARLLAFSALPLTFLGRPDPAIIRLQTAMRLNPFYDWVPTQLMGQALYLKQEYEQSALRLEEAAKRNPKFIGNLWWRAAAYAQLGRTDEARALVNRILKQKPNSSITGSFIKISDKAAMERLRDGWRKAGIPE